jgi:hypothetical protein
VYEIFARIGDGELLQAASCDNSKEARQLAKALNACWPREYIVRNSLSGDDVAFPCFGNGPPPIQIN